MLESNINKDYSRFSFEEFLLDDFFIKSVTEPTEESAHFWQKFREENKNNLRNYSAAKQYIEDTCKELLDEKAINEIWENILKKNRDIKRSVLIRYTGIIAAACIAFPLILRIFFTSPIDSGEQRSPDIVSFANQLTPITHSSDIQLILSDDEVISLSETESEITYDSASIRISSQEITKKAAASFNQLIIPAGHRSVLTFADGTKIWVNSGTKLIYPVEFEKDRREIYVDGEIYLTVAPDLQRPFIVRSNDMDVQVLGTRFNMQAYTADNHKRVVLESGSVKIMSNNDSKEVLLSPNKMYESNKGEKSVTDVDVRKYTSWIDGIYIYDNERLEDIFTRLSRYYGKEIVVDRRSADLRCSGKLDLKENLDDVLFIIAYTAPVAYTYTNDKYSITFKQ